tara:strand:+ start:82 stop:3222 length:3141 start_codon:yes stop_codon:yes gene_type:complete
MSKVFTANVIITKSRQAIEQLFFGKNKLTKFRERIDYLSEKDLAESFIATPENNEGLLRFEYSFGATPNDDPCKVKLSFVETSKLLEFVLLDNDPLSRKLAHTLKIAKGKEYANYKAIDNRSIIETLEDRIETMKGSDQYYMAFGVGDDITNWDGPHTMSLTAATLKNSEGNVRMVDATFVAEPENLKAWSRNFEEEFGYGDATKKLSKYLDSQNYIRINGSVNIQLPVPPPKLGGEASKTENNLTTRVTRRDGIFMTRFPVSLNESGRELLRNFIGSITRNPGNAVVAFPHKIRGPVDDKIYVAVDPNGNAYVEGIVSEAYISDSSEVLKMYGIRHNFGKNPYGANANRLEEMAKAITDSSNRIANSQRLALKAAAAASTSLPPMIVGESSETSGRTSWRSWLQAYPSEHARKNELLEGYKHLQNLPLTAISQRREGPSPQLLFNKIFSNKVAELKLGTNIPVFNVETQSISSEYSGLFEDAVTETMDAVPEGMNLNGDGNTEEYTESQKAKLGATLKPGSMPSNINTDSNFDAATEQKTLKALREEYDRIMKEGLILTLEMGTTNMLSEGKYSRSFNTPVLAPLSKFVAGLNEISHLKTGGEVFGTRPFDFFEETDMRILKLWYDYGIIKDPNRSAFVFGSTDDIRDTLYLNGYDRLKGMDKISGGNQNTWDSATLKPSGYGPNYLNNPEQDAYVQYRKDFEDLFLLNKGSRVSSFEVSDEKDDMSFVKGAGYNFDGKDIILKHNTKNPNVTSLNYSTKNYITSLLSMQIRPILDEAAIGTTKLGALRGIAERVWGEEELSRFIDSLPAGTDGTVLRKDMLVGKDKDKLRTMVYESVVKRNSLGNLMFPELREISLYDMVSLLIVAARHERMTKDDVTEFSLSTKIERFTSVKKDIMDRYAKQLFRLTLKTIPFFNHKLFVNKTCGLVGMTGGIVGVEPSMRHLAPYTGEYDIVGWKHVISSSEISTTFHLIRDGVGSPIKADATVRDWLKAELDAEISKEMNKSENFSKLLTPFNNSFQDPQGFTSNVPRITVLRKMLKELDQ